MKFEYQISHINLGNSFFNEEILDYFDGLASWHLAILNGKLAICHSWQQSFDYICTPKSLPMTLNRQYWIETGFWAWFYGQIYKCCNTSHKCILLVIGLGFQMSFVMSMHSLLPILLTGCSIIIPNYFKRLTFSW